nr:hypothetical protein Itr_chr06CG14180 [Ipomoea trifida]GMC90190.1 hypothetical protein Iba_scaffold64555CG0010 [Ipomoea batatas]GMD82659.1 hypothetical protein Iba_chr13fCG10170 [Ipomoea batatas]GMD83901.1 hypothetical protein Iba_scaffold52760CG0010 [Ipomoea batatas]GME00678.1 hypothetical protein Iba_scaffold55679CG0010 [Ipomoea batatas]
MEDSRRKLFNQGMPSKIFPSVKTFVVRSDQPQDRVVEERRPIVWFAIPFFRSSSDSSLVSRFIANVVSQKKENIIYLMGWAQMI